MVNPNTQNRCTCSRTRFILRHYLSSHRLAAMIETLIQVIRAWLTCHRTLQQGKFSPYPPQQLHDITSIKILLVSSRFSKKWIFRTKWNSGEVVRARLRKLCLTQIKMFLHYFIKASAKGCGGNCCSDQTWKISPDRGEDPWKMGKLFKGNIRHHRLNKYKGPLKRKTGKRDVSLYWRTRPYPDLA